MKNLTKISEYILYFLIAVQSVSIVILPFILNLQQVYRIGIIAGGSAAWIFIITQIPGIVRRLSIGGIFKTISKFIIPNRALWGIVMFLFGLMHYIFVQITPVIRLNITPRLETFQVFGFLALLLLFPLAATSFPAAQKLLKKWWKRLHLLVYIILWLIFGHVMLVYLMFRPPLSVAGFTALALLCTGVFQLSSIIKSQVAK